MPLNKSRLAVSLDGGANGMVHQIERLFIYKCVTEIQRLCLHRAQTGALDPAVRSTPASRHSSRARSLVWVWTGHGSGLVGSTTAKFSVRSTVRRSRQGAIRRDLAPPVRAARNSGASRRSTLRVRPTLRPAISSFLGQVRGHSFIFSTTLLRRQRPPLNCVASRIPLSAPTAFGHHR